MTRQGACLLHVMEPSIFHAVMQASSVGKGGSCDRSWVPTHPWLGPPRADSKQCLPACLPACLQVINALERRAGIQDTFVKRVGRHQHISAG
jgi:hypothetical protein